MIANSKNITPEERLLHLIENSKEGSKEFFKKTVGGKRKTDSSKSSVFLNIFSGFSFKTSLKKIGIHSVNKILIGISLLLSIVFLIQWSKEKALIQKGFNALSIGHSETKSDRLDLEQPNMPDANGYIAAIEKNNPFHFLPIEEKNETTEITLATEFKLVGILWTDKVQAIIEDSTSEQTYLVSEGDPIGEYIVTNITQTEVTLHADDGDKILQ